MGEPMNTIICCNSEGDEVHVIQNVPDGSVESVVSDLKADYTTFVVFITGNQKP